MNGQLKRMLQGLLILVIGIFFGFSATRLMPQDDPEPVPAVTEDPVVTVVPDAPPDETLLDEHGTYDKKDEVALYIYQYGHLPENYMTKAEARKLGWSSGPLWQVVEGKCIGGDEYRNYEGYLPEKKGRKYYECDIGTLNKKSRGAKRIIFSNDGLVYYTKDHYDSFELLYGEE